MRIASLKKRGTHLPISKSHQICNLHSKSRILCFGNFGHKKREFAEKRNIVLALICHKVQKCVFITSSEVISIIFSIRS